MKECKQCGHEFVYIIGGNGDFCTMECAEARVAELEEKLDIYEDAICDIDHDGGAGVVSIRQQLIAEAMAAMEGEG